MQLAEFGPAGGWGRVPRGTDRTCRFGAGVWGVANSKAPSRSIQPGLAALLAHFVRCGAYGLRAGSTGRPLSVHRLVAGVADVVTLVILTIVTSMSRLITVVTPARAGSADRASRSRRGLNNQQLLPQHYVGSEGRGREGY